MTIWEEIKESFRSGSSLTKLIYINAGVFLSVQILMIIDVLFKLNISSLAVYYMSVSSKPMGLLYRPWTLVTYMFLHKGFWHILSNILWLYWFGLVFIHLVGQKQLVNLYLAGGLTGAVVYFVSYNVFPGLIDTSSESILFGASASVMAIVVGIAVYAPNYKMNLILIGPVSIKYIALVGFLVTSLFEFTSNTGGKLAHIGGALFGILYFNRYRHGKDILKGLSNLLDTIFTWFRPSKRKFKVAYRRPVKDLDDMEYNRQKAEKQEEVDRILDKIAKSGYDSLTKKEKETLFRMGGNK